LISHDFPHFESVPALRTTAGSTLMHKDTSENSEGLKSGSSCNLPQTRLPKNTEEVAL
jgi:hypothetical protein